MDKGLLVFLGSFSVFVFLTGFVSAELFIEDGVPYVVQELSVGWNLIVGPSFADEFYGKSEIQLEHILSAYVYGNEVWPSYSLSDDISAELLYSKAFWVNSIAEGILIYPTVSSFIDPSGIGGYVLLTGDEYLAVNEELYGRSLAEVFPSCDFEGAYSWDAAEQDWSEISIEDPLDFLPRSELIGMGIGVSVKEDCGGDVSQQAVLDSGGIPEGVPDQNKDVEEEFVRVGGGGGFRPAEQGSSPGGSSSGGGSGQGPGSGGGQSQPSEQVSVAGDSAEGQGARAEARDSSSGFSILLYVLLGVALLGVVVFVIHSLRKPPVPQPVEYTTFPKVIPLQSE